MLRTIKIKWDDLPDPNALEMPYEAPPAHLSDLDQITSETYPDFLDTIGLVGMGGSGFPASHKFRTAKNIRALIINGIECEPGITIDQSLLLHDDAYIIEGATASARALGVDRIILAIRDQDELAEQMAKRYPNYEIVRFSNQYPAGAEKLIMKKLTGELPAPGIRPFQLGYLVQNVASLRAIGRALIDGISVQERPLTLAMPSIGFYRNVIVPIGITARQLFEHYHLPCCKKQHTIIRSGLMMGDPILKDGKIKSTTTSIIIVPTKWVEKNERPCIRCGACNTACPLGLHPFALTERIRKGKIMGDAYQAQLTECFMCGVCAAVCPSDLPLIDQLRKGKECL